VRPLPLELVVYELFCLLQVVGGFTWLVEAGRKFTFLTVLMMGIDGIFGINL
jgi:hypothetical protein